LFVYDGRTSPGGAPSMNAETAVRLFADMTWKKKFYGSSIDIIWGVVGVEHSARRESGHKVVVCLGRAQRIRSTRLHF